LLDTRLDTFWRFRLEYAVRLSSAAAARGGDEGHMDARLRMYLAELFATYLLVLVAAGTVCSTYVPGGGRYATVGGVTLGVALAEGIAVAVAVTTASYLSIGCCNPAITLTLFVAKQLDLGRTLGLIAVQLLGGFLAGLTLRGVYADSILEAAHMG